MNKIILVVVFLFASQEVRGMLKEFIEEGVTTNRFLNEYVGGTCPASSANTNVTNCGNSYINNVIGVNFVQAPMLTLGTYVIYNDFGTYVEQMSKDFNDTAPPGVDRSTDSVDSFFDDTETLVRSRAPVNAQFLSVTPDDYPAVGIYQLELSTSSSIQELVLPNLEPKDGAVKLVARLHYNGGASNSQDSTQNIYLWSQDAIYLRPTDSFKIIISNDEDDTATTVSQASTTSSLVNYFQYNDHTTADCPAYKKATNCPRKVRLEIA